MSTGRRRVRARPTPAAPREAARRRRLSAGDRRDTLVRAAAELMTVHGSEGVQLAAVASAAGVTRQLVYRFFPTRQALIRAVLEDFADDLARRFGHGAAGALPRDPVEATRVFIEAACDTIEAKTPGPWELLAARAPDPAVAHAGRMLLERVIAPWRRRIVADAAIDARDAAVAVHMIVAAGRAVLSQWYGGQLAREAAVDYASRGVAALLAAFAPAATAATASRSARRRARTAGRARR